MRKKIAQIAGSLKGDLVKFLREIIAIPSVSGNEEAVILRIKAEMEKLGYDKVWIDPLGNLLGQIGRGEKIIAFDGHCDTVDVGNRDLWQHDPFKGKQSRGVIYGRGACDQKGGLASAVYAGRIVKELGLPPEITCLVVASVLEEDYEGLCWQYILKEDNIKPQAVILTEPTSLELKIGQRGRMEIKVKTSGFSCHGSAPSRGDNAIYKIAPVIKEIELLNENLSSDSILGKGTIALTDISSTAPSLCAVADSATIHLDRRLTEGETYDTSVNEIKNIKSVKTSQAEVFVPELKIRSYTGLSYPVKAYYPMWMMEKDHPLVLAAAKAYKLQFFEEADIGVWGFSTNGVVTKGVYNIPSIGFGPGNEAYAHTPADRIKENDLIKAMEFYSSFTLHYI